MKLSFDEMKDKIRELQTPEQTWRPSMFIYNSPKGFEGQIVLKLWKACKLPEETEYFCIASSLEEAREEVRKMGFSVHIGFDNVGSLNIAEIWV